MVKDEYSDRHHAHTGAVTQAFTADLACLDCAEAVERALRRNPHVTGVHVDYAGKTVHVTHHAGMLAPAEIQTLISTSAHNCRCALADAPETATGGDLHSLIHHADMAAVTMSTTADRMQYEFPATAGGKQHHTAMGYDMSDPRLAKAMEADMRNRFLVALALTIPTVLLSPLAMNTLGIRLTGTQMANWLMLVSSTPVVWWCGWIFLGGAVTSLRYRTLNMSVLIATGVLTAWGFSVLITVLGQGETFYEAATMLVTFVLFGHWLEMKSRRGTTDALRTLFALVPPTARVLRDGEEQEVPTGEIAAGDLIRLRPGDKVPVDGVVVEGTTSIDESLVTGESIPVDKGPGDPVIGGSINRAGSIVMRALKVGGETALAQMVALVEQAQRSKAPGQRLADKAAAYLVIVAIGSGVITFVAWYVFGGATAQLSLTFAISAVVIACPDALGLATPTAVAVGIGLGAKHHILIKDAPTLEGISRSTAVVLDKTGTLTEGKPRLTDIIAAGDGQRPVVSEDRLLWLVASAEQSSEHPLAAAIVRGAREKGLVLAPVEEFTAVAGKGVQARVDGHELLIGNAALLTEAGVDAGDLTARAQTLAATGKTPMYIAIDGQATGLVAVADTIKPSARKLIPLLKQAGLAVAMITGDNRRTAEAVAKDLGIERVFVEVLPAEKAAYVRQLQDEGKGFMLAMH